ncbi:MAG TPA: rhodanese-like domain-containing protein [Bacillota bacterium]|nr:rhodanese-like domain-containing protein [Bacillota bacterium]HOH10849.1 rhodanese-like domain-containing protein [Bacillota bacterium]HOS50477.1 rhodanese-like domain-containing protein [Bacillota bacterium]HOY88637.1 rhodanese-like domain-containing protein [Bacillota bacterium]HPI00794.1 rhodanese-like domain-containing protein [Bacillota bacterium]
MKRFMVVALAIVLVAAMGGASMAAGFNPLVTTSWLSANLKTPGLVILDIRSVADYKAGHIPGAVNMLYGALSVKRGNLANEIPDLLDLQDMLQEIGISEGSTVVIYSSKYSKADSFAGIYDSLRIWFTLKYAGVKNVGVLDGGLDKWVLEKKEVSTVTVTAKAGTFKVVPNEAIMATADEVIAAVGKDVVIVDVRDTATYDTKHIKGAVSVPSSFVFNDDGTIKPAAELGLYAVPKIGTNLSKPIIVHCVSGRTANAWTFVLLEMMGYKNVATYDGSSQEFSALPNLPMEP